MSPKPEEDFNPSPPLQQRGNWNYLYHLLCYCSTPTHSSTSFFSKATDPQLELYETYYVPFQPDADALQTEQFILLTI
jgi:hypothetical protein